MNLPADTARCPGYATEPLCTDCARRLQIPHDTDPVRWYAHMIGLPENGVCRHKIPATGGGDDS